MGELEIAYREYRHVRVQDRNGGRSIAVDFRWELVWQGSNLLLEHLCKEMNNGMWTCLDCWLRRQRWKFFAVERCEH